MRSKHTLWFVFLSLPPAAWAQEVQRLTARQLFYTTGQAVTTPKEPPKKSEPPRKIEKPKKKPAAEVAPPSTGAQPVQTSRKPPATGEIKTVAYSPASGVPLGLRYSILKMTAANRFEEADPDTVFRAGDRIRLRVEVNDDGHLYVINRGSSGNWKPLFPSPEIEGGDNRVRRGKQYEIPAGYAFTFDEQAGEEKVFIVLSRRPEPSLEDMIYSLQQRKGKAPAGGTPAEEQPKVLLAGNLRPIGDGLVSNLRNAYARDLVIEKVDDRTAGEAREKAVYVVNPTGSTEARVVADVTLNHR